MYKDDPVERESSGSIMIDAVYMSYVRTEGRGLSASVVD